MQLYFQEFLLLFAVVMIFVPGILFLIELKKAMESIELENRSMKPGKVWLLLIPLFGSVWIFFVVKAIYEGMQKQFAKYDVYDISLKYLYQIGITMNIVALLYLIPALKLYALIPMMILWVLYWVKLSKKRKELQLLASTIGEVENDSIFSN